MISEAAPVSLADLQAGVEDRLEGVRLAIHRLIEADFPLIAQVRVILDRETEAWACEEDSKMGSES
jgi:hypothetical protein